jgi:hypothetical protein
MVDGIRRTRRRRIYASDPHSPDGSFEHSRKLVAASAAYDPLRDPKPVWESPFAELMGEPPIGRRAIDGLIPPRG